MYLNKKGALMILNLVMCVIAAFAQPTQKKHIVKQGETIETIAQSYNTTAEDIVKLNPSASRYIYIGMELLIPNPTPTYDSEKTTDSSSTTVQSQKSDTIVSSTKIEQISKKNNSTYGSSKIRRLNQLSIGPKLGFVLGNMSQPNQIKIFDGAGKGYEFGLEALLRFGQSHNGDKTSGGYLGVSLGIEYGGISFGTYSDSGENIGVNSLSIPLSVRLYPFQSNNALNPLYIEAGLNIYSIISSSPDVLMINHDDYSAQVNLYDNLCTTSVKPLIGIGYTVPDTGLGINVRYSLGISNISDAFPFKLSILEISATWMFNITKL